MNKIKVTLTEEKSYEDMQKGTNFKDFKRKTKYNSKYYADVYFFAYKWKIICLSLKIAFDTSSTGHIKKYLSLNTYCPKSLQITILHWLQKSTSFLCSRVCIFAASVYCETHKEDKCEGDRMCKRLSQRIAELISSRICNMAWSYIQHTMNILHIWVSRDNSLDTLTFILIRSLGGWPRVLSLFYF